MRPRKHPYRIEASREIFRGRVFTLFDRDILFPNGARSTFQVIEHPGAVAIVPRFPNGDLLLLEQLRVAAGKTLFEIPAGTREPGEAPLRTARREIVEETGYRARKWKRLAGFYSAPGFCSEFMHLYLATDLVPQQGEKDEDEILHPVRIPYSKARKMIREGRIQDAKSLVGILLLEP